MFHGRRVRGMGAACGGRAGAAQPAHHTRNETRWGARSGGERSRATRVDTIGGRRREGGGARGALAEHTDAAQGSTRTPADRTPREQRSLRSRAVFNVGGIRGLVDARL